jgi:DNA-binding XRE family transcriptional regulator
LRYQLKVHRLELHLTQADVAEVLGVHAVSI